MDDDRELLIERLRRDNDASRVEIERRAAARESDPAAHARAERESAHAGIFQQEWVDSIRAPYVEKFDSDVLLYRTHEQNEQTAIAASSDVDSFDADPPADDELGNALDKCFDAIERRLADLDRELVTRDAKIARLEGKVDALCQLLGTGGAKKLWVP